MKRRSLLGLPKAYGHAAHRALDGPGGIIWAHRNQQRVWTLGNADDWVSLRWRPVYAVWSVEYTYVAGDAPASMAPTWTVLTWTVLSVDYPTLAEAQEGARAWLTGGRDVAAALRPVV